MIEVFKLTDFNQVNAVIDRIKQGHAIALHLDISPEDRQRAVDYISGAIFSLNAHQEKVSEDVYLFYLEHAFRQVVDHEVAQSKNDLTYARLLVSGMQRSQDCPF